MMNYVKLRAKRISLIASLSFAIEIDYKPGREGHNSFSIDTRNHFFVL